MIAGAANSSSSVPNGYANGSPRVVEVPEQLRGRLHPNHYDDLAKSGLTVETIEAAGLHSEARYPAIASLVQWNDWPKRMGSALVFPYLDRDGREVFSRVKPDRPRVTGRNRKVCKYEQPKGQSPRPYIPRIVWATIDTPGAELLIGEGEKKTLAAIQAGFPMIGLPGVYSWMEPKRAKLVPDLAAISWKDRRVYIVFDSDAKPETVKNVQDAELRLAATLKDLGAIVKVVRLPLDDQPKMGLDDFLVAKGEAGPAELRKLMDAAPEPDEPDAPFMKANAKDIDPASEARAFHARYSVDDMPRIRYYRGAWWMWSQGRYVELDKSDIEARVAKFLDEFYGSLTRSRVGDVMLLVQAFATLSSTIEAPAWIAEGPDWRPEDCLATPTTIHHIPSLNGRDSSCIDATPRLFTTSAIDYELDEQAQRPTRWLTFLDEVFGDDAESKRTLQEWFGYSLTRNTKLQKILLLTGAKRSGKSTIARILRKTIGEGNIASPSLGSLGDRFGLWPLLGKSAAIFTDVRLPTRPELQMAVIEKLLSISGEDAQTIDRKNKPAVTQTLGARVTVISNELPRFNDASGAIVSRFIALKTSGQFYDNEDTQLTEKLTKELPAILWWAIKGWMSLRNRGRFVQPESSGDVLEEMHEIASPVSAFVHDRCVIDPNGTVTTDDLFASWREWCEGQGRREHGTHQSLGRDLVSAFPRLRRIRRRDGSDRWRGYEGIRLRMD